MGLFSKNKVNNGGLMDVIRCDEESYLIWKWRPVGAESNSTAKENSIRYGSSLRVKDGEVAVFVYPQKDGKQYDFIRGPFDETIKTSNFPILSNIIGAAFGGASPFQAEVYFINLANIIQVKFAIPFFDVFDPRFLDYGVPVAVRGSINFKITDCEQFIKLHRLIDFDLESFELQIRDSVTKYVKGVVSNAPEENGLPVIQLERKILQINELSENYINPRLQNDFGVTVSAVDINAIEIDKTSKGYAQLKSVTQDITTATTQAQASVNIKNLQDTQRIQAENMQENMRIQREEMQRAQKLQTEGANFTVHQLNQQTRVANTAAQSLGELGGAGINLAGSGMGFNPAGMMAGMAMGGAVGQNMAGMMNNMMQGVNNPAAMTAGSNVPPPIVSSVYHVTVNGQSTGPFDESAISKMIASGLFTKESLVWKTGMSQWVPASSVPDLVKLFINSVPPVPPIS